MIAAAFFVLLPLPLAAATARTVTRAEGLVQQSQVELARRPERALALAREALAASGRFVPTDFGPPSGPKGELLEDDYRNARLAYRRHRSRVYQAVGLALARLACPLAAARHLRRAAELDGTLDRTALAEALLASGRVDEALDALLGDLAARPPTPEILGVAGRVADALGLPSLQAELDERRLAATTTRPALEFVAGPLVPSPRTKLSSGAPLRIDETDPLTLFYAADVECLTCSADLEVLQRLVPPAVRVVVIPPTGDDRVLRQTLSLYRYDWPVLSGDDAALRRGVTAPHVLLVGRRGWSAGRARAPLAATLPPLLAVFARRDVDEPRPRPSWRKGAPRHRAAPRPTYTPGGLAPGEDWPPPDDFLAAQEAAARGRFDEAQRLLDRIAARDDGWLLPPEVVLNRAILLAAGGRGAEARALLLGLGDSRFQDEIDGVLAGGPPLWRQAAPSSTVQR